MTVYYLMGYLNALLWRQSWVLLGKRQMSGAHWGGRVVRSKWCVAATMMTAEVHYRLDLVNGNARTILHLDNSYSASACVGKSITGVIPLPVTLFLLSQQILWINMDQLRST